MQPDSGTSLIQELEDLSSPVSTFVRERCTVAPAGTVACSILFDAWKAWCEAQGHPVTQKPVRTYQGIELG
jgi:putative DNA primase/helicase